MAGFNLFCAIAIAYAGSVRYWTQHCATLHNCCLVPEA